MIEHVITADLVVREGLPGAVKALRNAGIPARIGTDNQLRLCQTWTADGKECLGYGRLEWDKNSMTQSTTFRYWPPARAVENVIDVDAREVTDVPRIA